MGEATHERTTNYPYIEDDQLGYMNMVDALEETGATVQYVYKTELLNNRKSYTSLFMLHLLISLLYR